MYACQLLLLQLLIWAIYNLDRLPEAICCCLQLILLLMYCVYLSLVLIKASYLYINFMLFTNIILPEAICCLETLNVYVVLLMLFCIYKLIA